MNDNNLENRESGSSQVNRDEDQRLIPYPSPATVYPTLPLSTFGDTSPTSPGAYYTTIQSNSSRWYEKYDFSSELI